MLKYLFVARYNDGTEYHQNSADISIKDEKRSCFYDVDHENLSVFYIYNHKGTYSVDLKTGQISLEVNGERVQINPPEGEVLFNFRVIYFRRHTVGLNYAFNDGRRDKISSYILGWQANTKDGKNVQRCIEILD